jgi:hypothetical protein
MAWIVRSTPGGDSSLYFLAYSESLGVMVGQGGGDEFLASSDMVTWVRPTVPAPIFCYAGVAYGSGLFVVASADFETFTSPDGFIFTKRVGTSKAMYDIGFGGGYFFGVGCTQSSGGFPPPSAQKLIYSANGIDWTIGPNISTETSYCKYVNNKYFIVGTSNTLRHCDTVAGPFVLATIAVADEISSIAYGNGVYVIVGRAYVPYRVLTIVTADLINFTEYTITGPTYLWDITFYNGYFYATANNGIYKSSNGITWTLDYSSPSQCLGIKAIPNNVVACRNSNGSAILNLNYLISISKTPSGAVRTKQPVKFSVSVV